MARPWISRPLSVWIACEASSSLPISTKANPRGRPVSRSITTFTSTTFLPPSAKTSRSSGSVTLYDKLPTYSLVPISFSFVRSHGFALDASSSTLLTDLGRGYGDCGDRAPEGGDLHARARRALRGSRKTGAARRDSGNCDRRTQHARTL